MEDKDKHLTDALFEADDQTVSRIAAQCPADWDMDQTFENSYRKYKALQSGKPAPIRRSWHFEPLQAAVTAACLLVTVGGAGFLWYLRNAAAPPDLTLNVETAPTAMTETADTTEPPATAATTRTADATERMTGTAVSAPAVFATETQAVTEPVSSAAAVQTTAQTNQTAPVVSTAAVMTVISRTTAPVQTSVRYVPEEGPSGGNASPSGGSTVPAVTETVMQVTETVVQVTETAAAPVTEPAAESPQVTVYEPQQEGSASGTGHGTGRPEETNAPDNTAQPEEMGEFLLTDYGQTTNYRFCLPEGVEEDPEKPEYVLNMDSYTIEPVETKSKNKYGEYHLTDEMTGNGFNIEMYYYEMFSMSCSNTLCDVQPVTINGRKGYYSRTETGPDTEDMFVLFWDNGTGISVLCYHFPSENELLDIASHFVAADS